MLITMKELLKVASKHHFTIGAFNVTEVSNFKCVFETAEELQAPTIIAVAANELDFCEKEYYQYVREKLMNSQVPYCLHLDHGRSLQDCLRAIQAGFTSVMFDGSHLPYEENAAQTKAIAEIAHCIDVSVEGEARYDWQYRTIVMKAARILSILSRKRLWTMSQKPASIHWPLPLVRLMAYIRKALNQYYSLICLNASGQSAISRWCCMAVLVKMMNRCVRHPRSVFRKLMLPVNIRQRIHMN